MKFELGTLALCAVFYLLVLFLIAHSTERRWLPSWVARHPATYVLSLGVYATTWSYYGSVGFARVQGINFLTIYLGVTLAFILYPTLLRPILRITRTHQLTSIADLFAFRFNSQLAGVLVTLMALTGSLPYVALQIRAVVESTQVLSRESSTNLLAFSFCVIVTVFAIIFGARHVTPREKHRGLVTAMAFESLFKLAALLLVALLAVHQAFGGFHGMNQWLEQHPRHLANFYKPGRDGPWASLLFIAFAAAFLLPRQFHMIFTENLDPRNLRTASWAFPLFLLLLSISIPWLLWSGQAMHLTTSPDYFVLGVAMNSGSRLLSIIAYLGGISAASAMVAVTTLALSSMSLNHLLLPLVRPKPYRDLYVSLLWARRVLIAAIIAAGFGFYLILRRSEGLVGWGLISFLAMAQFLPGVIGLLYWPRATRTGFIAGLVGGGTIWAFTALLPSLADPSLHALPVFRLAIGEGADIYGYATFWSLSLNAILFVAFSLVTHGDEREREAAAACFEHGSRVPIAALRAESPRQFVAQLASRMGHQAAQLEVSKALRDLQLSWNETRPDVLHRLRDQIERNLSGMMGPMLARMIVDDRLQLDTETRTALAQNIRLIEERLENSRTRLRGLAGELDRLRRYHRQTLEDLPIGVCAVSNDGRIARWNPAIRQITGVSSGHAIGQQVRHLEEPWGNLLSGFLNSEAQHLHRQELAVNGLPRWYTLHKANIDEPGHGRSGDAILLVEDVTDVQRLEHELAHSERLASIGRLAAGVAHEIGNPLTGIACLAQNLRGEAEAEVVQTSIEQILSQTKRIGNIVQSLVSYAHTDALGSHVPIPVRLGESVEEARRLVQLSERARRMHFRNNIHLDSWVLGDGQRLAQIFVNLFSNAADACPDGGHIEISARRRGEFLEVTVADDGPGIPAEVRDKVLEPFFTTKPAGQGTGLGLPLVYNIVKEHGGQLRIESDGHGTTVTLLLPTAISERLSVGGA